MQIVHDHPCKPFKIDHGPIAKSFTYDCRCGKLMIAEDCALSDKVFFGKEYVMELPSGKTVKPTGYIEV